jgi:hypothetical protein
VGIQPYYIKACNINNHSYLNLFMFYQVQLAPDTETMTQCVKHTLGSTHRFAWYKCSLCIVLLLIDILKYKLKINYYLFKK